MIAAVHSLEQQNSPAAKSVSSELPSCQSPSLLAKGAGQASFELKFLLSADRALELESLLSNALLLDVHAASNPGGRYQVRTLYTDTADLSVFHRKGQERQHKYRVRRYGDDGPLYLEQKTKHRGQVSKRRLNTTLQDLGSLNHGRDSSDPDNWFVSHVRQLDLRPVVEVAYVRRPWYGTLHEQPVRLTFDYDLRGRSAESWTFERDGAWTPLAEHLVVCEMKFLHALPGEFKQAIQELNLIPGGCSKYRRCVEQIGLARWQGVSNA